MGEVVEIQVSKGLTKQTSEKEWVKLKYTVKAKLDSTEELHVAKAQLEATVDSWLQQAFQPQPQAQAKQQQPDLEHAEVYDKLNWQDRTGSKGAFQLLRKDNCNDLQLYNHLANMLKQNNGNLGIGNWHYWLGQEEGYIFRRAKKAKQS